MQQIFMVHGDEGRVTLGGDVLLFELIGRSAMEPRRMCCTLYLLWTGS